MGSDKTASPPHHRRPREIIDDHRTSRDRRRDLNDCGGDKDEEEARPRKRQRTPARERDNDNSSTDQHHRRTRRREDR
jgi:hypothetical protein